MAGASTLDGVNRNSPAVAPACEVATERGLRAKRRADRREADGPVDPDRERRVGADAGAELAGRRRATRDPAAAVRTTAWTGLASRPPASERALVSMVTVYSVSGRQKAVGAIRSCRPAVSQVRLNGLSGEIRSAPATDAASIGASKVISIGAVTAWPVRDGVEHLGVDGLRVR